jgi:mannose-6-phosphate isomerase-like protein (cupin superfamily)
LNREPRPGARLFLFPDHEVQPKEAAMLSKHDLKTLSDAVSESWKTVSFARVNGLDVRLRVVTDRAANFHSHADSDELFCCLEGVAHLETDGGTTTLKPRELAVVPRDTSHRLRVEGRAVVLVIDAIKG